MRGGLVAIGIGAGLLVAERLAAGWLVSQEIVARLLSPGGLDAVSALAALGWVGLRLLSLTVGAGCVAGGLVAMVWGHAWAALRRASWR